MIACEWCGGAWCAVKACEASGGSRHCPSRWCKICNVAVDDEGVFYVTGVALHFECRDTALQVVPGALVAFVGLPVGAPV